MVNEQEKSLDESVKIIKEIIFKSKEKTEKEKDSKLTATGKKRTRISFDPPLKQNRGL